MFSLQQLLLVLSLVSVEGYYVNYYDESFTFTCPSGHSISGVGSEHSNHFEDRRFSFDCRIQKLTNCQWHGYANDWDKQLLFQCPNRGVISGVDSFHSNHYEDRRFKFYCCTLEEKEMRDCQFGNFVNSFDARFDFSVPSGHVLRGISSVHNNHNEDRRWKFETCKVQ